jgi:hypothetical protein
MPISFHLSYCLAQTLTTFQLVWNEIDDQGALHIANALQHNKVTSSTSDPIIHSIFHTDTHHTEPHMQWNRWSRSTTYCQCSSIQQSSILILSSYIHLLFHTDTHHTEPHMQWNRWSRSTTYCQCSSIQQSSILILSSYIHLLFHTDTHHTKPR